MKKKGILEKGFFIEQSEKPFQFSNMFIQHFANLERINENLNKFKKSFLEKPDFSAWRFPYTPSQHTNPINRTQKMFNIAIGNFKHSSTFLNNLIENLREKRQIEMLKIFPDLKLEV